MSNRVTIVSGQAERISGTSQKGKAWEKYRQKAYVHIEGKPFPVEFNIDLWPDRETGVVPPPHAPGEYLMMTKVVGVNRFNEPVYRFELRQVPSDNAKDKDSPPSLRPTGTGGK